MQINLPQSWSEFRELVFVSLGRPGLRKSLRATGSFLSLALVVLAILVNAFKHIWIPLLVVALLREALEWALKRSEAAVGSAIWHEVHAAAALRGAMAGRVLMHQAGGGDPHDLWHLQRALLSLAVRQMALQVGEREDHLSASWSIPIENGFKVVARSRSDDEPDRVEGAVHLFKTQANGMPCPGGATAAATRLPSVVADTHKCEGCFDAPSSSHYRSFISVPVYIPSGGQPIVGFLSVDHHTKPDMFTDRHAQSVIDIAHLLAMCDKLRDGGRE